MDLLSIAMIAGGLLVFSLLSGRLEGTIVTPPIAFIVFGFAIGGGGLSIAEVDPGHAATHLVAELTLVLVLFSDAARIDLARVRRDHNLPLRMLVVALPLTVLLGAAIAAWLFPELSLWEAALLAALLAPTDAALGQAVVAAKAVPVRIRQAINVESGLNDGIVLPLVLVLASLSAAQAGQQASDWAVFALLQVTLGPVVGIVLGYLGARALDTAAERGWATPAFQGIGILSLAALAYVVAELIHGNGFIAAFIGGMVFGNSIKHPCTFLFELMETEGQLLMLITFLIFGAALLPDGIAQVSPVVLLYAVLSLTVIRMIPTGLSLLGSGVRLPTQLFLGWFGPRGLASILFGLLIVEQADVPHGRELLGIAVITVALSALLHGASAAPLARVYGALAARMSECEENRPAADLPLRSGRLKP